jgi:hypothetical protein
VNVFGTILKLSNLVTGCVVEISFLRRLESDEGSWAKVPCVNNEKRKNKQAPGVFKQFLLVMLKISIYCAAKVMQQE